MLERWPEDLEQLRDMGDMTGGDGEGTHGQDAIVRRNPVKNVMGCIVQGYGL